MISTFIVAWLLAGCALLAFSDLDNAPDSFWVGIFFILVGPLFFTIGFIRGLYKLIKYKIYYG